MDWSDFKHQYLNCISLFEQQKVHFGSLKSADDFKVYQGFMMSLNHQAGVQGILKAKST